jgi:Holliday junction resolvase-like predicted endonuclease
MPTIAKSRGDEAEGLVAATLERSGWTILGRNVRVGRDELDIVAVDPGPPTALTVVEVRWRARREFGLPEETFDHRKQRRVRRATAGLRELGRMPDGAILPPLPFRIDLVVVEPPERRGDPPRIRHHRAALGR